MSALAPRLRALVEDITRQGIYSVRSDPRASLTPAQLEADIARTIYDKFHAHWKRDAGFRVTARDLSFEAELRSATPHGATLTDVEILERTESSVLTIIEGVIVRLRADSPLISANGRTRTAIPSVRPVLSPGFLLADGSVGRPEGTNIVRFYVHLHSQKQAVEVWGNVVSTLERLAIAYRAKVASSAGMLPRADAMVIYCSKRDSWEARTQLRHLLSSQVLVGGASSVFTDEIQSGFAYAEEPSENSGGEMSFGQHRSHAVARAVLRSSERGWAQVEDIVVEELQASGIDPARPWRDLR